MEKLPLRRKKKITAVAAASTNQIGDILMKLLTLGTMVLLLAGFALGGDCDHEDCDGVTPCADCTCDDGDDTVTDDCTCEGTVEGCTGDCCTCEADTCDEECTCECGNCEEAVEEVVEESHCGGGGCNGGGCH